MPTTVSWQTRPFEHQRMECTNDSEAAKLVTALRADPTVKAAWVSSPEAQSSLEGFNRYGEGFKLMTAEDFVIGARVKLIQPIGGSYPGSMYAIEPGPVGSVIAVFPDADDGNGEPFAHVRFDQPIEDLEDWDNVLYVSAQGDAAPSDFALLS
jgi:hypothetical protein